MACCCCATSRWSRGRRRRWHARLTGAALTTRTSAATHPLDSFAAVLPAEAGDEEPLPPGAALKTPHSPFCSLEYRTREQDEIRTFVWYFCTQRLRTRSRCRRPARRRSRRPPAAFTAPRPTTRRTPASGLRIYSCPYFYVVHAASPAPDFELVYTPYAGKPPAHSRISNAAYTAVGRALLRACNSQRRLLLGRPPAATCVRAYAVHPVLLVRLCDPSPGILPYR